MTAGCTSRMRAGVLHLTLDTRGSTVNVFTPAVAAELEHELRRGLESGARAVVLESKKPGSFINGVGLLLAASSHEPGAAMERAAGLQRCYEALASAPVPTIAAIAGNCYGCGLELALACDYRVAQDSYDTHFYMPELRDYSFIPLFGGTQRLPRLLGLGNAMRILLGERIDARGAERVGLVDLLAPPEELHTAVNGLLRDRGLAKWDAPRARRGRAPRVGGLPGPERDLALECLRLARLPLARGYRLHEGLREELASFWQTVRRPESTRAMSFFFVRQAAKAHAIGSAAYHRPARLRVQLDASDLSAVLRGRPLSGIEFVTRSPQIAFSRAKVRGALTCSIGPGQGVDCLAHLPFPARAEPVPPIELAPAVSHDGPWHRGAALFQFLEQSGFAPVVTRRFTSGRLLEAFERALRVSWPHARRALLEFGYRLPASLARRLASRLPRRGAHTGDAAKRASAALAREAARALDDGALMHRSQADLLAHLLTGYPVTRGPLLRQG